MQKKGFPSLLCCYRMDALFSRTNCSCPIISSLVFIKCMKLTELSQNSSKYMLIKPFDSGLPGLCGKTTKKVNQNQPKNQPNARTQNMPLPNHMDF